MNVMYSVYDRDGERFDFCEDKDNEFYLMYEKESDTLSVRHWTPEVTGMAPIVQVFFSPRRYVKDCTHD
jgi:hypothetical protein